jgi:hypothetical protein
MGGEADLAPRAAATGATRRSRYGLGVTLRAAAASDLLKDDRVRAAYLGL